MPLLNNRFNPVKEGDWQTLNLMLEHIFYAESSGETKSKLPDIKEDFDSLEENDVYLDGDPEPEEPEPEDPDPGPGDDDDETRKERRERKKEERKEKREAKKAQRVEKRETKKSERKAKQAERKANRKSGKAKKTKEVELDISNEYANSSSNVPSVNAKAYAGSFGSDIMSEDSPNQGVVLGSDSQVHMTVAPMAVPSSYFLDLRLDYTSNYVCTVTADFLTLHNVPVTGVVGTQTIGLSDISLSNNMSIAGPVAGGRDQSGSFGGSVWVNIFIIYNVQTATASTLSSLSATAPTLPTGYTYFTRVGCMRTTAGGLYNMTVQRGKRTYFPYSWGYALSGGTPGTPGTMQSLSISSFVPPTAIVVGGQCGASAYYGAAVTYISVGSDSGGNYSRTDNNIYSPVTVVGYGLASSTFFELPLMSSQTIYWTGGHSSAVYGIKVEFYDDDI